MGWESPEVEKEPNGESESGPPPWKGRSIKIVLDEERGVVQHSEF